jgi:hypothetical protein
LVLFAADEGMVSQVVDVFSLATIESETTVQKVQALEGNHNVSLNPIGASFHILPQFFNVLSIEGVSSGQQMK